MKACWRVNFVESSSSILLMGPDSCVICPFENDLHNKNEEKKNLIHYKFFPVDGGVLRWE